MKNQKVRSILLQCFLIMLYVLCVFIMGNISRNFQYIHIGNNVVESGRILSLFTVIQILITIFLTILFEKSGYLCSILLYCTQIFTASLMIAKTHSLSNIPGVFMNIEGIIIISIIRRYSIKLNNIANTDMLTKLNNRRKLIEVVERKIHKNKRFAFILVDLDDFKRINDLMGHDQGDLFLCQFVERWKKITQEQHAFFARIGGDEFIILKETKLGKEDFGEFIRNLLFLDNNLNDNTYKIKHEEFVVSASIGISFYPEDANTYTDLYRYADMAMYTVKNNGKQDVAIYTEELLKSVNQEYVVEHHIRSALQDKDMYVVFQPQYDAATLALTGAETLVRMKGKEGNTYSPVQFIPIAEKSNLIVDIDFFVFENALREFSPFVQKNDSLILSVNLSVKSLFSDAFIPKLNEILKETGFPEKNLQIEVTESLMISPQGKKNALTRLTYLHDRNIKLAIDDFGTGYSSLSYLKDLPFDTLKIDKAFVDTLSENEEDNAFVKAIITIGHILHMKVVSEGVETSMQRNILNENGCDILQGYLCGKPMLPKQFAELPSYAEIEED